MGRCGVTVAMGLAASIFWVGGVSAQERSVGLVLGYPASLGLHWDLTSRVAIRPEVSFDASTFRRSSVPRVLPDSESSTRAVQIGAAGLVFLATEAEPLRPYLSAGYTYSRSTSQGSDEAGVDGPLVSHGVGGAFGCLYRLNDRFDLLGETGVVRTSRRSSSTVLSTEIESQVSTLAVTGAVGIVFRF